MILGILSKTLALNNVQSYCIQLIVFAIQQLRHMPDGLKNLGASSFRHFGKGERLRGTRASEKCIVTKKRATNLQNRDALCSQPCTFAMGPGSGWWRGGGRNQGGWNSKSLNNQRRIISAFSFPDSSVPILGQ